MAKLIKPFILFLILLPLVGVATPVPNGPYQRKDIPMLKSCGKVQPRDLRPENSVTAYVEDGYIYISFEEPEGAATVLQIENGMTTLSVSNVSTFTDICVPLAYTSSPIQLLVETEYGNEYEGWIMPDELIEP